ncbi:MAG TPA: pilus assembly protein N-terminal domain-containing protein [Candidatus Elarobacter sp.]|nr:pilus assembly protein N-terminal domain-containing protein [Candidatus Elarobacter sp.]
MITGERVRGPFRRRSGGRSCIPPSFLPAGVLPMAHDARAARLNRSRFALFGSLVLAAVLAACSGSGGTAQTTPGPTQSATPSPSPTPVSTAMPTATATPTATSTATPTATPRPTATPTATPRPTATPTLTPSPTATPTASPVPVVVASPSTLVFSNAGAQYAQTFNVSEANYSGSFTASGNDPSIATVAPSMSTRTFTVTAVGNGQTTITVTDSANRFATVTVQVTLTQLGVNARTRR